MTLEEQIREAAARGITHLTLWPTPSDDGKKMYWRASATPSTGHKYVATTSLDPVEAMSEVLKALPKAPKRAQQKITATVTEPINMDESAERLAEVDVSHAELEDQIDNWLPRV